MILFKRPKTTLWFLLLVTFSVAASHAQDEARPKTVTMFDLEFGRHAKVLPLAFSDYACGTRGGPPSMPIAGFHEFSRCPAEKDTGLHEVHFRYDDEIEFGAKAHRLDIEAALYGGTTAYAVPVIVAALFDANGFLTGLRMVTDDRRKDPDPEAAAESRELGIALLTFLLGRWGEGGWSCLDLKREEGEMEFTGRYLKRRCEKLIDNETVRVIMEGHLYRKPGQFGINPVTQLPTMGQFRSETRLELFLVNSVSNPQQKLADLAGFERAIEPIVLKARNCPGCNLAGANLKRADLRGANLEGANLEGANLHDALLDNANLRGANLRKANLNKVALKRADLENAVLSRAMLFEAHLDGANLKNADLTLIMAGTVGLIRSNLTGADLRLAELRDARMGGAVLVNANLSGAYLNGAKLRSADFTGARMELTTLIDTELIRAIMVNADLREANLFSAILRGADLTGADLTGATLDRAILLDTNLTNAILPVGFKP